MEVAIGIVGFLAIAGAILAAVVIADKRRRDALERTAHELGFTYQLEGEHVLTGEIAAFPLFSKGRSKKARNLLSGTIEDIIVHIFDYQYTVGSGKNSSTHSQTVVLLGVAQRDLPAFELRAENVFHKIGGLFGYQDIDFDEYPKFSKRYLLRATDEAAVREVFTPSLIRYFEQIDRVSVEGGARWLAIYRPSRCTKPALIGELLESAFEIGTRFNA